jgi:hypothetical protein
MKLSNFFINSNRNISLIGSTIINRRLPERSQILKSTGDFLGRFIKNPIKETQAGLARDRFAVNTMKRLTGLGRHQVAGKLVNTVKDPVKDMAVNAGGLAGSIVGSPLGSMGSLAGDYAGAYAMRRGIDDVASVTRAVKETKGMPLKDRIGDVYRKSKQYSKDTRIAQRPEYHKDTIGWGIGNASASAMSSIPVPLKGAAVAMPTVSPVYSGINHGINVYNKTGNIKTGIKSGVANTKRKLKRNIGLNVGNTKEKWVRRGINRKLESELPQLPAGTVFKTNKVTTFGLYNPKRKLKILL